MQAAEQPPLPQNQFSGPNSPAAADCFCSSRWPGQGRSLDGNSHQSREASENWRVPAQADSGRTSSGQCQESCGRHKGRLTEGFLHVTKKSLLLCQLLLQNTAVEIGMCYKKIRRLDEGSKDKQGQCCKPAARSLANRAPFSWRVHTYHCCIDSIQYCSKICKVRFPSISPV